MIRFAIGLISDFIKIHSPFAPKKGEGFAFVVHPRDYGDVVRNLPFLKRIPKSLAIRALRYVNPFVVSKVTGLKSLKDGREITGWIIGIPLGAREIMENRALLIEVRLQSL